MRGGDLEAKRERELALIQSIHGNGISDEPRSTATPDFDGGVRGEPDRSPLWFRSRSPRLPPGWEPAPED